MLFPGQDSSKPAFPLVLSTVTVVWGGLCACTYLPRLSYLSDNLWHFSELWLLMEYGTLALTFVLAKRYTLTSS